MQDGQTWRSFLGTLISQPKEKQRIASELAVEPITLTRWVHGESTPRAHNLRRLLTVLPQQREQLLELIKKDEEFEAFSGVVKDDTATEIPTDIYAKVFVARAATTTNLRFWSICQLILEEAIKQLDPENLGMSIWVVRCMPCSGFFSKVRSLRESVGMGTPPWVSNLEQKAMFLGAESLAGNVVTLCRPAVIDNLDEEHNLLPTSRVDHEKSCAIYPILYAGRIAGALLVSSTQYDYFLPYSRAQLVEHYADLFAVAFEPEDFFNPEDIALCVMPSHEEQKKHFASFRKRVSDTLIRAAIRNEPIDNIQADMMIWQQLEDELIKAAAATEKIV